MKKTVIIDAGHGGLIGGEYQTDGKRSPLFDTSLGVLYEGEFNRSIADQVVQLCKANGIPYIYLDSNHDIPLKNRTRIINDLAALYNAIVISIHANAAESPHAHGVEVFTSPGQTDADTIAETWYQEYQLRRPDDRMRPDTSDGDHDKEARFWMLVQTNCPAILVEHPFMTNKADYLLLHSPFYRNDAAAIIFETIKKHL